MGLARTLAQLGRRSRRAARFIEALFREWTGSPVAPTHYYSPLPDLGAVKRNAARWNREDDAPGIDWNLPAQLALLDDIGSRTHELTTLPPFADAAARGYGPGYGEVEAALLHLMVRHVKPRRAIEVGSGLSTVYLEGALRANRERDGVESALTCIEPHPHAALVDWARGGSVALDAREVQAVGVEPFVALQRGDLLFIDSSHVSKKDSDVDFLVLQVLPRLAPGVVVHIHDIPLPMPALPASHPLHDLSILWNEPALVRAFLSFNAAYRIIQAQAMLHRRVPDALRRVVPAYDPARHLPTSLWIERC